MPLVIQNIASLLRYLCSCGNPEGLPNEVHMDASNTQVVDTNSSTNQVANFRLNEAAIGYPMRDEGTNILPNQQRQMRFEQSPSPSAPQPQSSQPTCNEITASPLPPDVRNLIPGNNGSRGSHFVEEFSVSRPEDEWYGQRITAHGDNTNSTTKCKAAPSMVVVSGTTEEAPIQGGRDPDSPVRGRTLTREP
ncbi:uncharacterized protein BP5553_00929 [Venustampulla echinocandica]|uniref:Uncharacterized protein n=1 Tax=Venustampulla echinocandica TaxID=2656787 RepID=A0A370TZM6_9HELO|nr:uncharacterized protein BP5553_00929 [Venustampulla echinocandica]RDL40950.1 hypothetical protein BP5553_00929 [Venustampulla echinocandica]